MKKKINFLLECKINIHFQSLYFDYRKSSIVLFLNEILNMCIIEEDCNKNELIQKLTDSFVEKVDTALEAKEKDLLDF